ncbi:MAG: DUF4347 domain-containing protein [Sedimentisphaeraceae bacterium JB056]
MCTRTFIFSVLLVGIVCNVSAVLLSDSDMYFDPATITPDYYPRIYLDDLVADNDYLWFGGFNPIVDADVLPLLNEGMYPDGYSYTQADYFQVPNVDYFADITSGDLTCTFGVPGLYHVRVTRADGQAVIYAVFAETALMEKDKAEKTSKSKKIALPEGDLFLAENSDSTVDNAADILENGGRDVERVDSRQEVIDKIKAKSQALGRKIHAELVGHGTNGNVSTGAGKKNIPDKQIDMSSVEAFQKEIDDYVDHITIQACKVGAGDTGKRFLKVLADSIGKAGAYDSSLIVVNKSHFALPTGGAWVEENTLEKAAHNFDPTTDASPVSTFIAWDHGSEANNYVVYMSQQQDLVESRDTSVLVTSTNDNAYEPLGLELGQTYYYAVDSYGGVEPYFSDVWDFTVQSYLPVEDFDYATSSELYSGWEFLEGAHGSLKTDYRTVDENSLSFNYDNSTAPLSVANHFFDIPQNWLQGGGSELSLWLQSSLIRETDMIILSVTDEMDGVAQAVLPALELVTAGDDGYTWSIPFDQLATADLSGVIQMSIIVDSSFEPCMPGDCEGSILIDDIKVLPPQCVELSGDLDEDGQVNLNDFRILAAQWMQSGC